MPRGNPNIWQHYGQSYAQLSASNAQPTASTSMPTVDPASFQHAAGTSSKQMPRGAGTFTKEASWNLTDKNLPAPKATEIRVQYQPPPPDYRPRESLRTDKSNFPVPNYPHEYKTSTQANFGAEALKTAERSRPIRPQANGQLLPQDVSPQYNTTHHDLFPGRGRDELKEFAAKTLAGGIATKNPGYNIITGGNALGNNVFEYHNQGRDYRRMR